MGAAVCETCVFRNAAGKRPPHSLRLGSLFPAIVGKAGVNVSCPLKPPRAPGAQQTSPHNIVEVNAQFYILPLL